MVTTKIIHVVNFLQRIITAAFFSLIVRPLQNGLFSYAYCKNLQVIPTLRNTPASSCSHPAMPTAFFADCQLLSTPLFSDASTVMVNIYGCVECLGLVCRLLELTSRLPYTRIDCPRTGLLQNVR